MYGFHKVPHVTNGPEGGDADGEKDDCEAPSPWHFMHPNFKRDRSDLLENIHRRTSANGGDHYPKSSQSGSSRGDLSSLDRDSSIWSIAAVEGAKNKMHNRTMTRFAAPSESVKAVATGGTETVLSSDFRVLVDELLKMRIQQSSLMEDLATLKHDSQLLLSESIATRQRQQKQQATIDAIVSFLKWRYSEKQAPNPVDLKASLKPLEMYDYEANGLHGMSPSPFRVDANTMRSSAMFPVGDMNVFPGPYRKRSQQLLISSDPQRAKTAESLLNTSNVFSQTPKDPTDVLLGESMFADLAGSDFLCTKDPLEDRKIENELILPSCCELLGGRVDEVFESAEILQAEMDYLVEHLVTPPDVSDLFAPVTKPSELPLDNVETDDTIRGPAIADAAFNTKDEILFHQPL